MTENEPELLGEEGAAAEEQKKKDQREKRKAQSSQPVYSRRQMLGGLTAGVIGGAILGAAGHYGVERSTDPIRYDLSDVSNLVDLGLETTFYDQENDHPAGIAFPNTVQRVCAFLQYDMNEGTSAKDLQLLLARWSAAAATMMAGKTIGTIRPDVAAAAPKDNAIAAELPTSNLTIAFGFGPTLFDSRFGLEKFKPANFTELPRITGDRFEASEQGSDFGIWIRCDDTQVTLHAIRQLQRIAYRTAKMKHVHNGYLSIKQHEGEDEIHRSIHGFQTGITGVGTERQYNDFVWVSSEHTDQEWFQGGTYMVYRDTFFEMDTWDIDDIGDQELLMGRRKDTGAPLSNPDGKATDPFDFNAKDEDGNYLVDPNAHCRLVSEEYLGFKVYMGGYDYYNGLTDRGTTDAGFINMSFVNKVENYIEMRDQLGKHDLANEYYFDQKSGLYAVPHAPKTGHYIGEEFFK